MSKLPIALVGFVLAVALAASARAADVKIYIMTDLEGASGVYKFAQTREPDTPLNLQAKEYLMGDIAAVVRGLRDGGATEIVIVDGHGSGAFVPHLMEPGAKYIVGKPRGEIFPGLDKTFAGFAQVGAHAMNGTPDGVLHHTQSSKSESKYWYNGIESGELAQCAAIAAHFGVPPILVTGDDAACRESEKFFGPACVTVSVKRGLSREAAVLYPFAETRKALYEGAKRSIAAIPQCKPYRFELPIKAKKQYLQGVGPDSKGKLVIKEGTIPDLLHLMDF